MRERELDLEALIKQTLHENVDQIPAPASSREDWDRLLHELKRHRAGHSLQRWKQGAAVVTVVLALVVGLAVFAVPEKVGAAGQKVIHIFKEKIGDSLRIISVSSDEETLPANPDTVNPSGGSTRGPRTVTLEEAEALTPYDLKMPEYLPEGLELIEVTINQMSGVRVETQILFRRRSGELRILETNMISDKMESGYSRVDGQSQVNINGVKGVLIREENSTRLLFSENGVSFALMILGDLPDDEIIKVGESLR